MDQEDFIDKTIKDNPIPADEAWRLYKGLKVGASLPLEWNARTTDLARYFYIEGHSSGIAYGRQTPDRESILAEISKWTDNQRLELFQNFCTSCGRFDSDGIFCQCWNDE